MQHNNVISYRALNPDIHNSSPWCFDHIDHASPPTTPPALGLRRRRVRALLPYRPIHARGPRLERLLRVA